MGLKKVYVNVIHVIFCCSKYRKKENNKNCSLYTTLVRQRQGYPVDGLYDTERNCMWKHVIKFKHHFFEYIFLYIIIFPSIHPLSQMGDDFFVVFLFRMLVHFSSTYLDYDRHRTMINTPFINRCLKNAFFFVMPLCLFSI